MNNLFHCKQSITDCVAYSHQNEGKLEPRARKCVFSGYPEGVKGYRLWDRSQKGVKIIVNRNVTFNESVMPCLQSNSDKQQDNEDEDSLEESRNISTNIPTTSSEVESQIQSEENEENEIIEEEQPPIEQPPLSNYQLARDT